MQLQTTTRQVVEHTLVISDDDLQRYMDDPSAFRTDVLAQRQHKNGGGESVKIAKPAQARRTYKRRIKDEVAPRKKHKANGAAPGPKHRATAGRKFPKVACSKCGQMIGRPQLGRHESRCNGVVEGAASASTE